MKHIVLSGLFIALFLISACSSDTARTLPDDLGNTDDINFDGIVPTDDTIDGDALPKDDSTVPGDADVPPTEGKTDADGTIPPDGDIPVNPDTDGEQPDDQNPDGIVPDETGDGFWPDDIWPDGEEPDQSIPDDTIPDGEQPDDTQPDDAQPDDTQPDDAQPDDAQPDNAQPDDAQPDNVDMDTELPDSPTPICTPSFTVDCPYTGDPGTLNVGPCKAGTKTCALDGLSWSACTGEVLPSSDVCTDSVDNDCNGAMNDGYPSGAFGCACLPGDYASCYTGPGGTLNVGICHAGSAQCNAQGTGYGSCGGQQIPIAEICGNGADDNCNNTIDDNTDADGDGWGVCGGDCCDNTSQCGDPAKVNPGAIEVQGDGIDNDCNGTTDEDPRTNCSSGAKFSGTTATDLVNGMDICKVSTGGSWGIVGTPTLTQASGSGSVNNLQIALMEQFGTHSSNVRLYGGNMATLSSGHARDGNDPNATTGDTYEYQNGTPPADFTAAHGGGLPQTSGGCPAGSGANDAVMLTVQLKVPTNALSFSFNFRFFSQEYWEYTCSNFNDFFIAMLYTNASGIPADKNISFDSNGSYISVNSSAFFTVCSPKSGYSCPDGTAPLAGTGYDLQGDTGGCDPEYYYTAGATKWLSTSAPVVPGETITLKFAIWDTSDMQLDSQVLLDNFKWSAQGSTGPSTFECWDLNKNGTCDAASEDQSGDGICNERDC